MGTAEGPGTLSAKNSMFELPEKSWFKKAENLHDQFEDALEDWKAFQREHGEKVRLWNTIHRLIIQSRTTEDFPTEELYGALGVNDYHNSASSSWSGTESVDVALHISRAKADDLAWGEKVSWSEDEQAGVEFIDFGRKLVAARVPVEIHAHYLIRYLKHGEVPAPSRSKKMPEWNAGMDKWDPPDMSSDNDFYWQFAARPFPEQIVILEKLTAGLGSCYRGRLFLAQLFEHGSEEIFNPIRIAVPSAYNISEDSEEPVFLFGEKAVEIAREKGLTVLVKDRSEIWPYLTDEGRVVFGRGPESQVGALEPHLTQVLLQLLPGLAHFYAYRAGDKVYKANPRTRDPTERVGEFVSLVTRQYFTDELISETISEDIDWSESPYAGDVPEWDNRLETKVDGQGTWTPQDTAALSKVLLTGSDKIVSKLELPAMKWTGPLKVLGAGIGAIGGMATVFDPDETDPAAQVQAVLSVAAVISSLDVMERYLPSKEQLKQLPLQAKRRRLAQFVKSVGRSLSRLGPILDVLGAILDVFNMVEEIRRGNYGSAAGSGLMAIGGGLVLAGSRGSWPLLVAGVVTGLIGAVLKAWFGGPISELTEWLKTTAFGTEWDDLGEEDFLDPRVSTYGYRRIMPDSDKVIGEIDFGRQVSALFSLVTPLGVTKAEFGREYGEVKGQRPFHYYGEIELAPEEEQDVEDIRVLKDGYLFLRPLPVYQRVKWRYSSQFEWSRTSSEWNVDPQTPGDFLHRFSLADLPESIAFLSKIRGEADDDLRSWIRTYYPTAGLSRRWITREYDGDEHLELEVMSTRTKRHEGDDVILRWQCRVWDRADGANQTRIFGWPDESLHGEQDPVMRDPSDGDTVFRHLRYVEFIYLPPEQADSILDEGSVSVRPEELSTVSRERVRVTLMEEQS